MASHSSILAWKIPWTEKCGGLQSMGWQRVKHYWATEHTHIHHSEPVSNHQYCIKLVGIIQRVKPSSVKDY